MDKKFPSMPALPNLNTSTTRVDDFDGPEPSAMSKLVPRSTKLLDYFLEHMSFYRIHLGAFVLIPLVTSGVFYACNGRYPVTYVDSLFVCYSAMTVTGLSTINLSTITVWQQVILFLLMLIGDMTVVSWVMVLIRKRFFRTHCEYAEAIHKRNRKLKQMSKRSRSVLFKSISSPITSFRQRQPAPGGSQTRDRSGSVNSTNRPNIAVAVPSPPNSHSNTLYTSNISRPLPSAIPEASEDEASGNNEPITDINAFSSSPAGDSVALPEVDTHDYALSSPETDYGVTSANEYGVTSLNSPRTVRYHPMMDIVEGRPRPKKGTTMLSHRGPLSPRSTARKADADGGFPGPVHLINRFARRAVPGVYNKLERKLTVTSFQTIDEKNTSWLNFSGLVVGRNSDFHTETLSDDQVEELGGAEYRALRLLSYLVPAYFVTCQLISFILFAPWISTVTTYDAVFEAQPRLVNKTWFSLFQVMAAYTGGGMSLVDMGMVPFQTAYLMIFGAIFSILAGNHALPIFLRLIIWISSKIASPGTEFHQALTFLLDHPRRCYLYLFPSHQTWFLVICLVLFSIIEWGSFFILNIGIPAYEEIPTGVRVVAGLFQGLAARASGFSIVPLASFAPSLLFLYIVMMYIAIYPVALSIRSTNVYEERSLGIFEEPPDDEEEDPEIGDLQKIKSRKERIGRYLQWHLRKQTSIDIWWLIWGVFLVCVIERTSLMDDNKKWFDLFRIIFELVSAFGGIGLTLGVPYDNFSFSGAFRTLSKLVVIVIMIRGRHRGLPLAVDRAVQLPTEMVTNTNKNTQFNEKQSVDLNSPQPLQEFAPIIRSA